MSSQIATRPGATLRPARLCVVTAAEIEFRAVAGLLAQRSQMSDGGLKVCSGRAGDHHITLLKAEIGAPGFAARLAAHLAGASYDALLVVGLAGGLDPQLKTGDAVIYDLCFSAPDGEKDSRKKRDAREENASLACDPALSEWLFETVRAAGCPCARGAGVTTGRVVVERAGKLALRERYGASAVDMETYQVIAACAHLGVPAAALRIILDEAGGDLPDFNRALGADGSLNKRRLAQALLARPLLGARCCWSLRQALRALRRAAGLALEAGW